MCVFSRVLLHICSRAPCAYPLRPPLRTKTKIISSASLSHSDPAFPPPPNSDSFPGWRFLLARIWQPMQSLNHLGRVLCIIYFLSHKNLNKHETIKCRLSWENTAEQVICHRRHVISHDMTFRWKEDHLFCGKAVGCKSSISCCCFWRENTCSGIFLTSKMSKQKIQRWIIKRGREQRNSYWRLRRSSAFWRIWL